MRVTLADLRRESSFTVGDVVRIESTFQSFKGHLTRVWFLELANGRKRSFMRKDYMLCSVMEGER